MNISEVASGVGAGFWITLVFFLGACVAALVKAITTGHTSAGYEDKSGVGTSTTKLEQEGSIPLEFSEHGRRIYGSGITRHGFIDVRPMGRD